MTRHGGGSVFFLTDYGHADEFAGVVRAVVQRCAPGAPLVDLAHDVAPFDVRAGALMLQRAVPHLGPGVVLAVVDPGVGTDRRAVVASVPAAGGGPRYFVGPDNGLLAWAVDGSGGPEQLVVLPPAVPRAGGATFDGRDLFAPAAARLWSGSAPEDLGDLTDPGSLVRLAPPLLAVSPGVVEAEVLWVDRFGNVQLSARPDDTSAAGLGTTVEVVTAGGVRPARWVRAFGALGHDDLGVVHDANGHVALACDRRPAATVLGVRPGDVVTLRMPRTASGRP
ncbi:MAG: SAM-dependent chlorinase/fluorinase [Acidimicrobiales bacterium]